MARLNVNPTRQELLKLKKKLKTAKKGHKLLKEKRDGLMKEFLKIIREAKALRESVEKKLATAFQDYLFASVKTNKNVLEESFMLPSKKTHLEATTKNVMSVNIPIFKYQEEGHVLCYSLSQTSAEMDDALNNFSDALKDMVNLAAKEHSAKLLAAEIEKTRRRVNALEYVFIPNMEETNKYIYSKLSEQERGARVALMKIKEAME